MISSHQISQQKNAIADLKKLVEKAADSPEKEKALAYCDGCIAACELAEAALKSESAKEEKPKKTTKRAKKTTKKEELTTTEAPAEVKTEATPVEEPTTESQDDFDDLL